MTSTEIYTPSNYNSVGLYIKQTSRPINSFVFFFFLFFVKSQRTRKGREKRAKIAEDK